MRVSLAGLDIYDQYLKIKDLPPGHVDIKRVENQINKIYENCKKQEYEWMKNNERKKRNKRNTVTLKEAIKLCNFICDQTGEKHIKGIFIDTKKRYSCYNVVEKTIYLCFYSDWISTATLVHELTHHYKNCKCHDEYFCQTEKILFEVADLYFNNKL
jgi:IS30 family transposase